ncbi:DUF4013 domain-containing protein [bacterium]|nr:DUF4013 domain-containing protein [bacterium]
MNYSEALSFTFNDEDWLKKLGIGGLFALLSVYAGLFFILGFFIMGYYIGVLRNVMKGEEKPLPDWSDMGKIFVDGLLATIITLFYFVVIGGICAMMIVNVANDYMPDHERVLLIIFISLATLVALTFFINYGLMQLAATNNFAAAFQPASMIRLIKDNLGNFIAVTVFSITLNGLLFLAGLGIVSPFTNFWGLIVQAHLFGQVAKEIVPTTTAVQSA